MATQTVAPQATSAAPTAAPAALDQDIVNLAKAIRSVETRGQKDPYTAKGGSGEYGAYQYTEDTWNGDVKAFTGKSVPLSQADKILQNEVAYKKLESLKKQGYNPGQIASIWNSGGPEWEGKVGINKYGVRYDVPKYVDAVATAYHGFKSGSENPLIKSSPSTVGEEQRVSPAEMADTASGEKYGAFFPAVTGESMLGAGVRTAGNLPGSAFNFAKGAINTLNPVNTINTASQIPGAFSALSKESGGVLPAIAATAKEIPHTAYEMLVPEAIRSGISALGGFAKHPEEILPTLGNMIPGVNIPTNYQADIDKPLQQAERAMVNDPFGQVAPVVLAARAAAGTVDAATGGLAKAKMTDYVKNIEQNTAKGTPIPKSTGTNFGGAMDTAISKTAQAVEAPVQYAFGKAGDFARGGPKLTAEDYAGEILQGDSKMRTTGARVLSQLDTKGKKSVSTYDDLSQRLGAAIEENQAKTDLEYAKDTTPVKLNDLTQKTPGAAPINYVSEALKGLQEFYTKSRDVTSAAWAKNMLARAKKEGLTPADINQIAKKYGGEFGTKAFSKVTGEPLTSVNAQAYENIRTGLKSTARSFLKEDAAKALDKTTSDMIRVKEAADKVLEKVNALDQRIQQRGILTRLGRALGGAVDLATGGLVRGFFQKILLDSNRGNKSYNSIQIEENLQANLKKLQYLEKVNDSTLLRIMKDTLSTVNNLPETTVPYAFGKANAYLKENQFGLSMKDVSGGKSGAFSPKTPQLGGRGLVANYGDLGSIMFTTESPLKVYRGEGKGIGNATFVKGRYFADSEKFAANFGKVSESEVPKGASVLDFDAIKHDPAQKLIPKELLVDPEALTNYLMDRGVKWTKNTNTRGVEYVELKRAPEYEVKKLASKYDTFENFVEDMTSSRFANDNPSLRPAIDAIYSKYGSGLGTSAFDVFKKVWDEAHAQ